MEGDMKLEDAIIERIEELKKKYNITQYELSVRGGIPQTTLISIKRKRSRTIGIKNLWLICDGFGITVSEFFQHPMFDKKNIIVE